MKKKLESDVTDLDLALEHANAGALETQGTIKKYQNQVRDAQVKVDEESHLKAAAQDAKVNADRKAGAMQNSLEEGRTMLEQADRARRSLEQELADSEEKAARAMIDAARLADELRAEQDFAMNLEKDRKLLEAQCKDAQSQADEAEVNALKGGKKAMMKMETRVRELES